MTPLQLAQTPVTAGPRAWPDGLAARTVVVRQAVTAGAQTPDAVAARFVGARRADVAEVLDALAGLGLVHVSNGAFMTR